MKPSLTIIAALIIAASVLTAYAEEKIPLEPPKQGDPISELRNLPDGVLRVKTNDDGTFRSLVVKASVEIEDSLGAAKGKQIARKEAETKCKQALAKWLQENCQFRETQNKTATLVTKGDSSKDAAGNVVKLRSQQGTETKEFTEISESKAQAVLRGLTVLQSEVTADKEPEYVLIMGLSQELLDESARVRHALSEEYGAAGAFKNKPATAPGNAAPAAEVRTNPAAKGF